MLHYEQIDGVFARISLDRPDCCNALSADLLRELIARLESLRTDTACRVLLIGGEGPHFCAGLDLREASRDESTAYRMTAHVVELLVRIRQLPQIVIGAVHGAARGGGAGLALACDLVVAADDATFAFPEVRRGFEPVLLFPLLRRKFGDAVLRRLLLTGRPIGAEQAREWGFVLESAPRDKLDKAARDLVREILDADADAVRATKRMLIANENSRFTPGFAEEMQAALDAHARSWNAPAAQGRIREFLERK